MKWLILVILVLLVVWLCHFREGFSTPTTPCGWLYFDIKNMTYGWTDAQANEARDICQTFSDKCGESEASDLVRHVYRVDPFIGTKIIPLLKSATC